MVRALTLPGAGAGVAWFIGKFEWTAFTPRVVAAAFGQVFFTLSLGGTMMVIYGSYLKPEDRLAGNAAMTVAGDTRSGVLAGFAILPAVVSLGLLSASEPDLIFVVLPRVFATIPLGRVFGLIFFVGLLGSGFLSAIAAWEVQVAALTDNTPLSRRQAVGWLALLIFLIALPPMPNQKIFLAWDLTFGSGMQTLGSLFAVVAVCWCLKPPDVLRELGGPNPGWAIRLLYVWLRYAVPVLILLVGVWWLASDQSDEESYGQQSSPRQASSPSRTSSGVIPRAATGSAHHQPKAALRPMPARVIRESHQQAVVWKASAFNAWLPRPAAARRLARASQSMANRETTVRPIPTRLADGRSRRQSESASGGVLVWRLKAERTAMAPAEIERLDHRARRLVGVSLYLLAAYVAIDAALCALAARAAVRQPGGSWPHGGLAVRHDLARPRQAAGRRRPGQPGA